MNTITVQELKQKIDSNEPHQLIDVREDYEYETGNINGVHIPMGDIADSIEKIATDKPVIVQCRSGKRSASVIQFLESKGIKNLHNLEGGILAWKDEIDPSVVAM